MNVVIITGFLGSGKTTILIKLAKALSEQGKKVAVIENEVGKTGIDGEAVKSSGLEVREIYSGCICCTLRLDLKNTLIELERDFSPDVVFVEPSGAAGPFQVLSTLDGYGGEIAAKKVLTVIDASRCTKPELYTMPIVADGIVLANVIAVNKTDIASKEDVEFVVGKVGEGEREVSIVEITANSEFDITPFMILFEADDSVMDLSVKSLVEDNKLPDAVAYVKEFDDFNYKSVVEVKTKLKEMMTEIALITGFGSKGREGHIKSSVMTNPNGSVYAGITDLEHEAVFKGWIPAGGKIRRLTINAIVYNTERKVIEDAVEHAVGRLF